MKLSKILLVLISTMAVNAYAANRGCDYKAEKVQQRIEIAKSYGNIHKQRGLERALANIKKYCSDKNLLQDQKSEIVDKEADIHDIEADLSKKKNAAKADKVKKLENKLAEKRAELAELQEELKQLEQMAAEK